MRRLALIALIATMACAAGCGGGEAPPPAPIAKLPKLHIGMTLGEARRALGGAFESFSGPGGGQCTSFQAGEGIGGLATDGVITVVSLSPSYADGGAVSDAGPATDRGLRPGHGLAGAIARYGRPDAIAADEYGAENVFWRLPDAGSRHVWLRLTTSVSSDAANLQIGTAPDVYNVEGCA